MTTTSSSTVFGWLIVLLGMSAAIAALACVLQRVGFAPIGLFSLLVGAAVGASALLSARWFKLKRQKLLLAAAILAAISTTAWQHGFLYLQYRESFLGAHQLNPRVALFRESEPQDFATYIRAEAVKIEPAIAQPNWVLWLVDLVLCIAGAVGIYTLGPARHAQDSPTPST